MTTYNLVTTFFKDDPWTMDYKKENIPTFDNEDELVNWVCKNSGWPYFPVVLPKAPWEEMYKEIVSIKEFFIEKESIVFPIKNNPNLPDINKPYLNQSLFKDWKNILIYSGKKPDRGINIDRIEYCGGFDDIAPYYEWDPEISHRCPEFTKYFKKPFFSGVRLLWLDPHGYVGPHVDEIVDSGLSPAINIALSNPSGSEYRTKNKGYAPFKVGAGCMLNRSVPHSVWNKSDEIRIHVIVSYSNDKQLFNKLIVESLKEVLK
jgi:hypothetical protein